MQTNEITGAVITVPDWLIPTPDVPMDKRMVTSVAKELTNQFYETLFEHAMERLAAGTPLPDIINEYHTATDIAKFRAWIYKDPTRKSRYESAQELFADALVDDMLRIADGVDSLEDVQRTALRLQHRKWIASCLNRRRYGDSKQVEITENKTTNIRMILEKRERQLLGEVIDGEFTVGDDRGALIGSGEDAQ
jgi:hypothetical protein